MEGMERAGKEREDYVLGDLGSWPWAMSVGLIP
jgi:hypothetical protein